MESVERYGEGVTEAQRSLKWYPHNPTQIVEAYRALGRCFARLGRVDEAGRAFQTAIAEATRVGRPYHEMLAHCDYIQSVPHLGSKTATTILSSCAAACEFAAPDILKAIQNLFDEEPCTRATDVARSFGVRAGGVESLLPRLLVRS